MTKVVVIGLDGATWDLLKPWADNGKLPAIKKLMDNGVWGELESTIPPVTGPAWTSFSTGKNPGKHGIFDFVKLENNSLKLHQSKDIRSETIYDILSQNNLRSVVIGLPLSFPPKDGFNGVMISDFLHASKEIIPEVKTEYIKNYRVFPNITLRGGDLLEDMVETAKSQIEVAKQLFLREEWDFYYFYFFATDGVAHHFWKEIKENTLMGQKAKKLFYIADQFIGWVLSEMDTETILFLMSDHGFADCPFEINLNNVFKEKGLLKTRITDMSEDKLFIRHLMKSFAKERRRPSRRRPSVLRKFLNRFFLQYLGKLISKMNSITNSSTVTDMTIDFANSEVFVATSESMSVYVREVERGKSRELTSEVVDALIELEYNSQRIFKGALVREQVYSGPYIESAPNILLVPNGFHISSRLGDELYSVFNTGGWHDLRGIFLAFGSTIRTSLDELTNLRIYDIMPTILHIFGLPISPDVDGRVLKEIFTEQSDFAKAEIIYDKAESADEKLRVKGKIVKLRNGGKI